MKKHLLISILALMSWSGIAQVTFEKGICDRNLSFLNSPFPYSLSSVKQTSDGGYIISGETDSLILLIKTDSNGDTLWLKTYGGNGVDIAKSVIQTTDGGYFITGSTTSFGAGNNDVYIIKTDSLGVVTWSKTIGGTSNDYGKSGEQTNDGGYIITGSTNSFGAGSEDIYLIKTDSNGDTTWTKTYGSSGNDMGDCVKQTIDGGYIITGAKGLGVGSQGLYLLKTNGAGDTAWSKIYILSSDTAIVGVSEDTLGEGYSVQQTTDGGYIITGNAGDYETGPIGVAVFIKTNSFGNIIWSDYALGPNEDFALYAQQTMDGGYIMAVGSDYAPYEQLSLIKTDSNGTQLWTHGILNYWWSGHGGDIKFVQTIDSGYVVAGSPIPDYLHYVPNLIKTDKNGNTSCNYAYDGGDGLTSVQFQAYNYPSSISLGGIVTIPTTIVKRPSGVDTTYCTTSTVGIKENYKQEQTVSIYPNPFTSQTTISFSEEQRNSTIYIRDVLGKEVRSETFSGKQYIIDKGDLDKGIYFVQIIDENKTMVNRKIIVQ